MIVCGFPGTGKSIMAKYSNWIDLESTPFKKNWQTYAEVAKHFHDNGRTVMVSTHQELLEKFEQIEVPYTVVIPPLSDMSLYMNRYIMRGNQEDFIELIRENWEHWLLNIIKKQSFLKTVVILPRDGCIQAWAEGRTA